MSTISLRLPNSLHRAVRMLASKEMASMNQVMTLAIAEKVSALLTEDYLGKRARRGNRTKFLRALKNAGNEKPREEDRRL